MDGRSGPRPKGRRFYAGLRSYQYDSQERLEKVTTGQGIDAPSTQYAHNALGQRVFKTEPLFSGGGSGSSSTTGGRNLNNLLADPEDQEEDKPGLVQTVYEFFTRLWSPGTSEAQKLGYAYVYGQDGTLLGEYGMGGSNSSGTSQYLYLPTANGPMPIAAIVNGTAYAVHSDHLNTPRKLTQADGQVAWQWAYSAFGDEQPTLGAKRFTSETTNPTTGITTIPEVTFNLRYPGQYYDKESNLHYNYFRSYSAERGRYTQADPIGLDGGFNRFGYVNGNPLNHYDPYGLWELADIFPDGAPIVTMGRSFGALAAYLHGISTGNSYLSSEAMEGLQCSREANSELLGVILSAGRGGSSAKGARGVGNLKPHSEAIGPHSTFYRNPEGKITRHGEWAPNAKNPTGFDEVKRVDTQYTKYHEHVDRITGNSIGIPHVHDRLVPGGVRPAAPSELPK